MFKYYHNLLNFRFLFKDEDDNIYTSRGYYKV